MKPRLSKTWIAGAAAALGLAACAGGIEGIADDVPGGTSPTPGATPGSGAPGDPARPGTAPPAPPPADAPLGASRGAIRRLTQAELRATIRDLLGADPGADIEVWPEDARTPFDNDYGTQFPSRALVEAAKSIADRAAARLLADAAARARVIGCAPSGSADAACFRQFVTRFGRRALRRPLAPAEVDGYAAFLAHPAAGGDFNTAVGMVLRAMLQDIEFLYRIERGTPVPGNAGLLKLNGFEVAARLSYLLWGSTPDDVLLDAAARNDLATPAGVRTAATRMLAAPRARERLNRFHALWLGWEQRSLPSNLVHRMEAESNALIERVVFDEKAPWLEIFRRKETFVEDTLARHYGLPLPGSTPRWVPYGTTGRQGILSHGTFLSVAGKFADTSPTQRGILIRERLLCQHIPPPDPSMMVNVDEPPKGDAPCKWDRYEMHRVGGCAACHSLVDPVGFGLENYDITGKYRSTEPGLPQCRITGEGELVGVGTFRGPAELGNLLLRTGDLDRCAVRQLYQFASGRKEQNADDETFIDILTRRFREKNHRFDELLLEYVAQPTFGYRVVE